MRVCCRAQQAAVEKGVLLANAMHAELRPLSFFDRKNYFYPDLPRLPDFAYDHRWLSAVRCLPMPASGDQPATFARCILKNCTWKRTPAKPRMPTAAA
jgi:aspartyl-tRNA(Asn)/glutamyl-tRNA(Gln) amidotransferase subunit B